LSAANFVESALVIDGSRDPIASRRFDDLVREAHIAVEPVTEAQARIAREAYRDFGKGSGHPAKLNFGGCFAYALAGEPLLFKGEDFTVRWSLQTFWARVRAPPRFWLGDAPLPWR
jgi:ribonuclease VapC